MFLLWKKLCHKAIYGLTLVAVHIVIEVMQAFFGREHQMDLAKP
jgi:hypothetical protein